MSLVQSNAGGSGSSAVSQGSPNTTTSAVGFNSNTTAGNLLVCVAYATQTATGANLVSAPTFTILTSGFSWTSSPSLAGSWTIGTNKACGSVKLFYIPNASSMSSGTTTTVTAFYTGTGGLANATQNVEFELYEFSGIATTTPIDVTRTVVTGTTVGNGNMTTTKTDLVIVASTVRNTNVQGTAGSGFTLGINASLATIGQLQYQLNTPAGTVNTNFTATATSGEWSAFSVGFKAPASTPTSNSYGFYFGD